MKKHLNRAVCLALLLLFVYAMLALILTVLHCTVQPIFYLWAGLLCLCTWCTTCTKKGIWIGLPSSALLLYAASRFFPADLGTQLDDVLDLLTGAYWEQIAYPGDLYPYLHAASDHSLLFLFLVFLLSSYMGAAITSHSGRISLALLGSVPFFVTCLAVSVSLPVLPVFGMILFWFLLAVGGSHYDEEGDSYRRTLGMLLPLSLLLSLLLLYVDPPNYTYDPSTSAVSQTLNELIKKLDTEINRLMDGELTPEDLFPSIGLSEQEDTNTPSEQSPIHWQDSSGNLDLANEPDPMQLNTVFLRVRAEQSGSVYLRAVSYGDYRGSSWTRASEDAPDVSLSYTASAVATAGTVSRVVHVQSLLTSEYRYLPYFSMEEQGSDSFVPASSNRYSARYSSFPDSFNGLSVPAERTQDELQYRAYAYEYYTRLPESTRSALQEFCLQNNLYPDMEDPIAQVASLVQRLGQYDAGISSYPSTDYAVYFLTQSRLGCCVHFATAATALYRTLGIPARITGGFLVEAKAGETVDVKGSQAHAWVEVYEDGLGWLPVEITGHSGLETDALGAHDSEPSPEPLQEENASLTPLDPVQTPSSTLPIGLLAEPVGGESNSARTVLRVLLLLLLFTALLAALPLRRRLLLLLRSRSFVQRDMRKAVIAVYNTALKAAPYGAEPPPLLVQTAERAAFSQHEIRAEELEACEALLVQLLNDCYCKQNSWNRFRFKYLSALL